ncbi:MULTISPECIES: hypothetical protein [Streptomyces]|nr:MULTISPECIES: hypothetical protein [Streptomyces]
MPAVAELLGAVLALAVLAVLTGCSVRSITRRRAPGVTGVTEQRR